MAVLDINDKRRCKPPVRPIWTRTDIPPTESGKSSVAGCRTPSQGPGKAAPEAGSGQIGESQVAVIGRLVVGEVVPGRLLVREGRLGQLDQHAVGILGVDKGFFP